MLTNRALALMLLGLAACHRPAPSDPHAGKVQMKLVAKGYAPVATAPSVCAAFSLTPYSLDASGAQALAGAPVTINSSANGVTPILGCVATPGVSPDWRYLVTASQFVDCNTQQPIAGLSPAVESFTVDVTCVPGQDVSASVVANVSIPVANDAGYIDVSVSVNATTQQSGCKVADIDGSGQLHFGQSWVQEGAGTIPSAYTGLGFYTAPAQTGVAAPAGSVRQFVGAVSKGSQTDAFFTGLLQLPAAPQSTTLVQAFVPPCPDGQMNVRPQPVECVTQAALPSAVSTQVKIADVLVEWPGRGAVSASITGQSQISLYTSQGGPHLGTLVPPVTGYDGLTQTQVLDLSPRTAIGLYGSLVHAAELLAVVQDATLGPSLVVLTLDEGTGRWSAGSPLALSSFTVAQQQAFGLFGQGGCFPEPIPACAPPAAPIAWHGGSRSTSFAAPGSTLNITLKHADGTDVTAASPALASQAAPITVHLQWSASGLQPGHYAYPAVTLCSPFAGLGNTNGGSAIGPPCDNGYEGAQTHGTWAFPAVQADSGGGVTQDLQFTVTAADFFTDVGTWTIPFQVYEGSSTTPDLANDVALPESSGVTGATVYLTELHDRFIVESLESVTPAPGGLIFRLSYAADTTTYNDLGYGPHYLEGHSHVELSPPSITNGLVATLQGTPVQESDGHDTSFAAIEADKQINSNQVLNVTPDAIHGGIPSLEVDNLLDTCCNSGGHAPTYRVDWFVPTPTAQGTVLTVQGSITWNGTTDTHASFSINGSPSLDISPVPVSVLDPLTLHTCFDSFLTSLISPYTSLAEEYDAGKYLPDGTFVAAGGPAPLYPAHVYTHPLSCAWMFNWHGEYDFTAQRMIGGYANEQAATLINPDYVIKVADDEVISTSYVDAAGAIGAAWAITTSDDAGCDYTTRGDATWTDARALPLRTDWSAARCLRYHLAGVAESPYLVKPFLTRLRPSITASPAVGALRFTTTMFWATADNVLPDTSAGAKPGWAQGWATDWVVSTWDNSSILEINQAPGATEPVDQAFAVAIRDAHVAGLSVPDLVFTFSLSPGAAFDTATTPASWFVGTTGDEHGASTVPSCALDAATQRVLTCTLTSPTGAPIPGQGGSFVNTTTFFPRFKFISSEVYNGEQLPRTISLGSHAAWLVDSAGTPITTGSTSYDTVIGPNQLSINKAVHGGKTSADVGAGVAFDLSYGAGGLESGQLGAGGVAIYDFFGRDFQPGQSGAPGAVVAQPADCVRPVPVSIADLGSTGGTASAGAAQFFYTTDASPGITSSTTWLAVPAGGALPAGTTGVKIVPVSSKGAAGVLLPIDGSGSAQVILASAAGAQGRLCNSAALTASQFQPTATPEASVTLNPPCDPNAWKLK